MQCETIKVIFYFLNWTLYIIIVVNCFNRNIKIMYSLYIFAHIINPVCFSVHTELLTSLCPSVCLSVVGEVKMFCVGLCVYVRRPVGRSDSCNATALHIGYGRIKSERIRERIDKYIRFSNAGVCSLAFQCYTLIVSGCDCYKRRLSLSTWRLS